MTRCLRIAPDMPDAALVREAARVLQDGGVVAYPTDTVYGLAVDAMNRSAIARLYAVKHRPPAKAVPLIIGDLAQLSQVAATVPSPAEQLIRALWPGPLTLLFEPHDCVPARLRGDSTRIGVRWPAAAIGQQLALALGRCITASSANLSGGEAALSAAEVAACLTPGVDLILDGGTASSADVSTVLDVTVDPPAVLRAGRISVQMLEAVLGAGRVRPLAQMSDVLQR